MTYINHFLLFISTGNIVVSDMYLQCLLLALADVTKAEELSRKHNTTLAWSQETLKWIECGKLIQSSENFHS